jgi:Kef-type K+ transport system membrane component KefB
MSASVTTSRPVRKGTLAISYLLLVLVPVLAIVLVLEAGSRIAPGAVVEAVAHHSETAGAPMPRIGLLLAQIFVVLVATRTCGLAVRRLGQPQVVGEMLAGLLLGPSFLGWLLPGPSAALFPAASLGYLSAMSQVGLLLFMFLVGIELDSRALRERGHAAILTSHASITVPFAMGVLLALPLYERFAPPGVAFIGFALFLGASMSVTAFPVLARILVERGLLRTPLGTLATSAAAVDDVTAWTILAAIMVIVHAGSGEAPIWVPVVGVTAFVGIVYAVREPIRRWITGAFNRRGQLTQDQVALLVAVVLVGACITEALGVHALFGAFFVGLTLASERRVAHAVRERLEDLLVVVLLPLYFAFTGLRTRLGLLFEGDLWGWALAIFVVAVAGKLGGSAIAARISGTPWREATALGILMNTRGLMELVILNIGLDLGVLSPALYSMMVLMALATTVMTTPLLALLRLSEQATASAQAGSR